MGECIRVTAVVERPAGLRLPVTVQAAWRSKSCGLALCEGVSLFEDTIQVLRR